MPAELPELLVADAAGFRVWLGEHHSDPTGVWLVLRDAKRADTRQRRIDHFIAMLLKGEKPIP